MAPNRLRIKFRDLFDADSTGDKGVAGLVSIARYGITAAAAVAIGFLTGRAFGLW